MSNTLAETIDTALKPYMNSVWRRLLVPVLTRAVAEELRKQLSTVTSPSDITSMINKEKGPLPWSPCV